MFFTILIGFALMGVVLFGSTNETFISLLPAILTFFKWLTGSSGFKPDN